jgi:protoporphyrin/coproporphyrin ferrochelatase
MLAPAYSAPEISSFSFSAMPPVAVLLVNLGTPDSPEVPDVRRYLREFLMDGRVLDVPFALRWALVNLVIAPFRSPKSAKVYKELWTERGSPLKFYGEDLRDLLQNQLGEGYKVALAMRYQNPGIEKTLNELKALNPEQIVVVPLFPQYASASSGSVYEKVMEVLTGWQTIPQVQLVGSFFQHPLFLEAFAQIGQKHIEQHDYDYFLFSYHGLPERQIRKGDDTGTCLKDGCCDSLHPANRLCYRGQCFETTRLLAQKLNLPEGKYGTSFQSRLGRDPWIKPYTDNVLKQLAGEGKKNILTFSPSFIADCLETTIEIGEEYRELFEENGGEHWQLVESLNVHPLWVEALTEIVKERARERV